MTNNRESSQKTSYKFAISTLLACIFWIYPNEGCSSPTLEDWPLADGLVTFIGDIECGETVINTTTQIGRDGIYNGFWHVYRLLVQGDNCVIDVDQCSGDEDNDLSLPFIQVFNSDREMIPVNRTACGLNGRRSQIRNLALSSTTCTEWYIGIGGRVWCAATSYIMTITCSECTACMLPEETPSPIDCSLCTQSSDSSSSSSSESGDDAKVDLEQYDEGIFAETDDVDDGNDGNVHLKEVTLQFSNRVWGIIYGAMVVVMVEGGVLFCVCSYHKTNKRYV